MRYQERIYIQNNNEALRNKDILNVNMSSDVCVFTSPIFNLSGASKIDCTGFTGTSYVVTTATTIPLTFQFTANTNTFTANTSTFKYEIYKYDTTLSEFTLPPIYQSAVLDYSGFSATNSTTQAIPVSGLSLDGEYLVKGYYQFSACTDFMGRLGKTVDTLTYRRGTKYGLYESNLDFFFRAIKSAQAPIFTNNGSNSAPANNLYQQIILPSEGETQFSISNSIDGFFVVTLNGLALAPQLDYIISGNVFTLSSSTVADDIISIIYTTGEGTNIVGTTIDVSRVVTSGVTDGEGTKQYYFNTSTSKYEIYTDTIPAYGNSILVMINGATLANGVDFYQSSSNPKRIILEGDIIVGDVILIVYIPQGSVVNGLLTNTPIITWLIPEAPQLVNGYFGLEVSTASTFNTFYFSGATDYVLGQTSYSNSFTASGTIGTTLYYRVKNEKNFVTMCGDIVGSTAYSETIPIVVQTNSINSY